jgi:hypothetical protein
MDNESCQRRIDDLRRNPGRIEVMDDAMAEILRRKTGAERLAIANRMFVAAREMLRNHLRVQHPDWTDSELTREVSKRLLHGIG